MKNRKIWAALLALMIIIGAMLGLWMSTRETAVEGGKTITVAVNHGDKTKKVFTYRTDAGYLGEALLEEGLVQGETGPYGLEIHTVDGETASWEENRSYWALYIGTEYATTGADGVILTDGGEYLLEYTIG